MRWTIIDQFEIVVDGTDNFSSRYMINDACVLLNKPLVYGAISQHEGQIALFNCRKNINDPELTTGTFFLIHLMKMKYLIVRRQVCWALTGIIGCMLASETIKLITGIGSRLQIIC